jgi:hypothetical protein
MKYRKVTGDEREKLLRSRKPAAADLSAYREVLDQLTDGDVVAIGVDDGQERREKVRFGRAAAARGKSLRWLNSPTQGEIVFAVGPARQKASRS